jgi:hypothetical protein
VSEENQSRLDFSKCQNLTTEASCVSKQTISCICREAKKGKWYWEVVSAIQKVYYKKELKT